MSNFRFILHLFRLSLYTLFQRILGNKKHPDWDTNTELIWRTTRFTFLASHQYGLRWLQNLGERFSPKPKFAAKVSIEEQHFDNHYYLKISPKTQSSSTNLIIYFHGGGYVLSSPKAAIEFTTRLSLELDGTVFSPAYPKAPVFPYPAAHNYSTSFVQHIIENHPEANIYLAGDSAGGALVLSSFQNLSSEDQQRVKGCILISPWIDPLASGGSMESNAENDIGDRKFVVACYDLYVQDIPLQPKYPLSFLQYSLPQLPPTFISIGEWEILYDQTVSLKQKLAHQTDVTFKEYKGMFHTFWNLAPKIKEAETLIKDIGNWVR